MGSRAANGVWGVIIYRAYPKSACFLKRGAKQGVRKAVFSAPPRLRVSPCFYLKHSNTNKNKTHMHENKQTAHENR